MHHYLIFIAFCLFLQSSLSYSQMYKYQDEQGTWHFSDKKPKRINSALESIDIESSTKTKPSPPYLDTTQANGKLIYSAHNPLLIPVQFFLKDAETNKKISTKVISPLSSEVMFKQQNSLLKRKIKFHYVIGDPNSTPDNIVISPPFTDYKPMKVSQGFNGKFSHNRSGNRFAVDISMPVGTKITAVKDGIVIRAKGDYVYAGVSSPFFFDKANLVEILHADGSYAVYAHLLLGGVKVKVGEQVSAGQTIGLSGNTGYSTGPHLHFVIRHNANGKTRSIPFMFSQTDRPPISPKKGEWLLPSLPKK